MTTKVVEIFDVLCSLFIQLKLCFSTIVFLVLLVLSLFRTLDSYQHLTDFLNQ